jgi:predicted helicase
MPETIDWAVDDVIELLRHADMDRVLKDFPQGRGKEDPVIHFYETFLAVYNPALREKRGVFYTPHPAVSYIVRSVDQLLVNQLSRPKGLADEHTLVLDPAVGTATFLYSVIEQIYDKFETQKGAWDGYVATHLLRRIFGFELLMAPYAVAHLKIGMQLEQTGYHFGSDQRLGIYLTNTLEEAMTKSEKLFEKWISDEANEAAAIKRDKPILVVLGNPPYSGESANRSRDEDGKLTFIGKLIDDYKIVDGKAMKEKVLKWLHDDYVKFIRFAHWRLDRTGEGIIAYITNNAYLDNPTFPGMRRALMNSFSELWIYNLHGSARKKDKTPEGGEDKNVFDIMQGVAILLGVKQRGHAGPTVVHYADLWGSREHKYTTLLNEDVNATQWLEIDPHSPNYFFVRDDAEFEAEYDRGYKVTDIFTLHHTGIITKRDSLAIHWTADDCFRTVKELASLPAESAREKFDLPDDVRDWRVEWAQADVRKTGPAKKHVIQVLYRPFDVRYTYYTGNSRGFLGWPVADVTPHMLPGDNIALVTTRLTKGEPFQHVLATRDMNEVICLSSKTSNNGFIFPLYLYAGEQKTMTGQERRPNFDPSFLKRLADALGVKQGHPDSLPEKVSAEDIIGYICAILHSPVYRARYASLLARDFPRIPITTSKPLFGELAKVGRELLAAHLLESPKIDKFTTSFPVAGNNIVETVQFDMVRERVMINETQYFGDVPAESWDFFVGGYRVADKWLKDRKNRQLTYEDTQHYQRIIAATLEIRALMKRVDAVVENYGGWPIAGTAPV